MSRRRPAEPAPCRKCGSLTSNLDFVCDSCKRRCSHCKHFRAYYEPGPRGRFVSAPVCLLTCEGVSEDHVCDSFEEAPPPIPVGTGSRQRPRGGMSYRAYAARRAHVGY